MAKRNQRRMYIEGWVLAARTSIFAASMTFFGVYLHGAIFFWAFLVSCVTIYASTKKRFELLPYCFLAASTMWAGTAASIAISGGNGLAVMFALFLSTVDSSSFVQAGCRGLRR